MGHEAATGINDQGSFSFSYASVFLNLGASLFLDACS